MLKPALGIKKTGIEGIGTGTRAGTQLLVVVEPDTGRVINFDFLVPVLRKYGSRQE